MIGTRTITALTAWLALSAMGAALHAQQADLGLHAVRYERAPVWQQAAVATLNRHLPTDSGYWALGPLDRSVDTPDTTRLLRTTLRLLAPGPAASRTLPRRIWFPTGGVALQELQPNDTLPHELPPGYPGRLAYGSIVGEKVYVQVMTVQEHRWLLWADRVLLSEAPAGPAGPLARYSRAVRQYLAAIDSGQSLPQAPTAAQHGLDRSFDLFSEPPGPVIRDREGYRRLLASHRAFDLGAIVTGVYGFIPSDSTARVLGELAEPVLFTHKAGEPMLQRQYRDYRVGGGDWHGAPVLSQATLANLSPGRYAYAVDRYGAVRVGRPVLPGGSSGLTAGLLLHGEPVRVAGMMTIERDDSANPFVASVDISSEDYFFSNRVLSIYEDVRLRSDRYLRAIGHVISALEDAGLLREELLVRKF